MTVKTNITNIYQFKISLKDITPEIWRRIQVPDNYSFWDLHVSIQNVMGWSDNHLHQFEVTNPLTLAQEQIFIPEENAKITKYFLYIDDTAIYEYNLADRWVHEIILEKILPAKTKLKYPICIDGQCASPPEDCGGTLGYKALLEIIKNPKYPEYPEYINRLGNIYKTEYFDPTKIKFDAHKKRWKAMFK